jgi:endoglucanase
MSLLDAQTWAKTYISWMNGNQSANGGPSFSGNQQGVSWSWWYLGPVC